MANRPNVVIFNPDSYRGDVLGHLGNPGAVTPHLDAFVADGGAVSYANAFAQNPVCTPSRCSFMTGWYPHVLGHRSMRHMLKEHEPHLLKVLGREGYTVWWGGKNDLVAVQTRGDYLKHCTVKYWPAGHDTGLRSLGQPAPGTPLYKVYYRGLLDRTGAAGKHIDRDAEWVAGACDFLRQHPADSPFCVFLPLGCPHPAYQVEAAIRARIPVDKLPPRIPSSSLRGPQPAVLDALRQAYESAGVTEDEWREIKAVYYAMCTHIDDLFGQVIQALREAGQYDNTLVFFMSDHGDFAGDYELPEKTHSTLQDALLRVPLLVKPPAGVPVQPGIRHHLAELVDMPATIYDLLGIEPGYTVQGKSLRASLAGAEQPLHDAVFAEVGSRPDDVSFFNTEVDKMPPDSFYGVQSRAAKPFAKAGSYAVSCRTLTHKYIRRGYTDCHELYDLTRDPGETCNLSGQPQVAEIERTMQMRLLDYFMRTGDILPHQPDSRQV